MNFFAKYAFPILTALIICAFYVGLPLLRSCILADPKATGRPDRKDILIILAITAVYAFTAFTNLGSTKAPQSFWEAEGENLIVIELEENRDLDRIMFYAGINVGSYNVELSADGENYHLAVVMEQSYAELLRWHSHDLEQVGKNTRFVRISSSGNPRMGELALFSGGEYIPYSAPISVLNDESGIIPAEYDYFNGSYFDEIYHVRTAVEHMESMNPYEISHPPLGKLIISVGISLFGLTPFGWRFMGTLLGVLMLPVMYVFAKRLFGGRAAPACCTLVFAADFMHYTQTRMATIDTYAVFFILLMYLFMYLWLTGQKNLHLALCGLAFGLGAASKWTCLYAGAGLALLWGLYWLTKGRKRGFRAFVKNSLFCLVFFVLIPALIYYVSYYPYGAARGLHGIGAFFTREYFHTVISNQEFMFSYHAGVDATHPYSSMWYQWILDIRPILYYLKYYGDGSRSSFGAFVNPAICWAGLLALFVLIYTAIFRRDKKAAFILLAYLAQLLPWVFVPRLTFAYHYFPCTVFLILALGYVFRLMELSSPGWRAYVYGFTGFCIALFIMFYPVISGAPVSADFGDKYLGWLPTWPF